MCFWLHGNNNPISLTDLPVIPPVIFEDQGKVYAACEYAHIAFYVPIFDILNKSENVLDNAETVLKQFTNPQPGLVARIEHLRSLIADVKAEVNSIGDDASRMKRDLNWNLNLDLTQAVSAIFAGLNNLVHAPSLKKLQQQQKYLENRENNIVKVVNGTIKLLRFLNKEELATQYKVKILSENSLKLKDDLYDLNVKLEDHMYADLTKDYVDFAIDILEDITKSIGDFARGEIPAALLHPDEAKRFFLQAQHHAQKTGKILLMSNPLEIYNTPISVHARNDYWFMVISFPYVHPSKAFDLRTFHNVPFFGSSSQQMPLQLNMPDEVMIAMKDGLEEDTEYFMVSKNPKICKKYGPKITLCRGVKVHRGTNKTCIPALISQSEIVIPSCTLKEFCEKTWGPYQISNELVMFFDENTELYLMYPNATKGINKKVKKGRYHLEAVNGLTVKAGNWHFDVPLQNELMMDEKLEVNITNSFFNFDLLAEKPTFNHSHYVKVDDFEQEKEDWINGQNETFIDEVQEDLDYDNDYNSGFEDFEDSEIVTYSTLGIAVLALVIASVTACFVLKAKFCP